MVRKYVNGKLNSGRTKITVLYSELKYRLTMKKESLDIPAIHSVTTRKHSQS
jgi:hypothetical protein